MNNTLRPLPTNVGRPKMWRSDVHYGGAVGKKIMNGVQSANTLYKFPVISECGRVIMRSRIRRNVSLGVCSIINEYWRHWHSAIDSAKNRKRINRWRHEQFCDALKLTQYRSCATMHSENHRVYVPNGDDVMASLTAGHSARTCLPSIFHIYFFSGLSQSHLWS